MKAPERAENRVAVITGAASGLGRAVAKELVESGINCVIMGRRDAALAQTMGLLTGSESQILAVSGDVTVAADRARVMTQCLRTFGRLDIIVYNTGPSIPAPLLEYSEQQWRQVMNTNLDGCFFMAKAVIPSMRDRGWGASSTLRLCIPRWFLTTTSIAKYCLRRAATGPAPPANPRIMPRRAGC